jgi:hypothetical protein
VLVVLPQVGEEPLNKKEVVALRAELRSPAAKAELLARAQSPVSVPVSWCGSSTCLLRTTYVSTQWGGPSGTAGSLAATQPGSSLLRSCSCRAKPSRSCLKGMRACITTTDVGWKPLVDRL